MKEHTIPFKKMLTGFTVYVKGLKIRKKHLGIHKYAYIGI